MKAYGGTNTRDGSAAIVMTNEPLNNPLKKCSECGAPNPKIEHSIHKGTLHQASVHCIKENCSNFRSGYGDSAAIAEQQATEAWNGFSPK